MHPSGTVTFLFTDIEGSSQLWEQYPQLMQAALARHDTILREAIESHEGQIVKTTGDGVHAVFSTAADGVAAVIAAQQGLIAQPWSETGPLMVRMALHTGEAELREGDYYGPAVNRAARLMSIASGGQVLLSTTTAELARDKLPAGVTISNLGQYNLRGMARAEHVYQLHHPDLPAEFPPLKSALNVANNLPAQLTSFIGRESEVGEVRQLLTGHSSDNRHSGFGQSRLITLTGPGGTGKTRLSLEAAGGLLDYFPDGVWLVELAPLADPDLVVQTVAKQLGLVEHPGRPLQYVLADHLRRRQVLLILDNCEHLIDECARLADALLHECPNLSILASSREALGIGGERAFRVRSLALPREEEGLTPEELAGYEAIRLFEERAGAVKSEFRLTPENSKAVAQICRRLDGIPLAIELAAARIRALSPEQLAARLDDRFRLLTGGSRTALPRQRTLQALIDWSYDLLSASECVLLNRLSVFSGGWTLEAAENVAGVDPIEPFEVLDLLDQLVNKSLVVFEESDLGLRYLMLETIRQYAQAKLAESGEADKIRNRHLAYFVEEKLKCAQVINSLQVTDCLERLITDSENFRVARSWALEHDLSAAIQLTKGYSGNYNRLLSAAEAMRYGSELLVRVEADPNYTDAAAPSAERRHYGTLLVAMGMVSFSLGFNQQALTYISRGYEIAHELGDVDTQLWAHGLGAVTLSVFGNWSLAEKWGEDAIALSRQSNHRWMLAMGLVTSLGYLNFSDSKDSQEIWARWENGMALFRQGGDLWGLAMGHQMAAQYLMVFGDAGAAKTHAERSLALFNEWGDVHLVNIARSILAELARKSGDLELATSYYFETLQAWRDSGNLGAVCRCLECLAFIYQARAVQFAGELRVAYLAYASTLLSAALASRLANRSPMTAVEQIEYDEVLAAIRESAGEDQFQVNWARGQRMDLDQAIDFALEDQPELPG